MLSFLDRLQPAREYSRFLVGREIDFLLCLRFGFAPLPRPPPCPPVPCCSRNNEKNGMRLPALMEEVDPAYTLHADTEEVRRCCWCWCCWCYCCSRSVQSSFSLERSVYQPQVCRRVFCSLRPGLRCVSSLALLAWSPVFYPCLTCDFLWWPAPTRSCCWRSPKTTSRAWRPRRSSWRSIASRTRLSSRICSFV